MKDIIVIVGPTGIGKTKLSIELAKRLNGEIISADSMQIYEYMDIGSAKITKEEMQNINHYMSYQNISLKVHTSHKHQQLKPYLSHKHYYI